MRLICRSLLWLLLATTAQAQGPVQDPVERERAIQRGQLRAGAAYREIQQAQYEAKLAEQDYLNAVESQHAAQKHAEDTKRQLGAATKALEAARQKEIQARKRYDEALTAVDQAFKKQPARQQ